MKKQDDIHFLSAYEDYPGAGLTSLDLYYRIEGTELDILFLGEYHRFREKFPFSPETTPLKERLREILFEATRYTALFSFEESDLFTEAEFNEVLERRRKLRREAEAEAAKKYGESELVRLCEKEGLNPAYEGGHPQNWVANCINAKRHRMHINPETGQWGCGYCRIKGDLEELKQRLYEEKASKN